MATKRISRKELKKPDEFLKQGQSAVDWMSTNSRGVGLAVAALLAGGVLATLGSWAMEKADVEAGAALGDVLELVDRPILTDTKPDDEDDPFFPSEDERNARVEKALEALKKDHTGSVASATADLLLGDLAYRRGEHSAALSHYETFLENAPRDHTLRFSALEGIALVRVAQGDDAAALTAYERLTRDGGEFYQPFSLVGEARVLIRLERPEDARARAQRVVDDHASSPIRREADAILASLPPAPDGLELPRTKAEDQAAPREDG